MRLARYEHDGWVSIGVVIDDRIVDLPSAEPALPRTMVELLAAGPDGLARVRSAVATADGGIPLDEVRLLAPVERPEKFLAIGLNYPDHTAEGGMEMPEHPVFFNKQISCITGANSPILKPSASDYLDYEGELGVVIGATARNVPASRAAQVVAGYTIVNDVSVRDWQFHSPTWTMGKSYDTHGPVGPWIVTADDIPDPHDLRLRTFVNDAVMQDASTSEMAFDVWDQIEYLSHRCTLRPGDIISTGTPAGVGIARTPPVLLAPGDVVRIEIEGIGELVNTVEAEPANP